MSTLIAVVSDLHAGSTVAIHPPEATVLDDGAEYRPSKPQRWLWQCWEDYWDRVEKEIEERQPDEWYLVVNGDLVEGDHHGTAQIVSRNPVQQFDIAKRCLKEPLDMRPDRIFMVRGTESHVGKSGSAEEGMARSLETDGHPIEGEPEAGTQSWFHLRMDLHGHRLDFTHHGRTGYRPWTRHNATLLLAAQIVMEHAQTGDRWPDLSVRSHFHRHSDSYDAHPCRVIQTPAWQLKTAYVHKKHPESIADVGGVILDVDEERIDVTKIIHKPDRGTVWQAA